jgi:hypothetical protein
MEDASMKLLISGALAAGSVAGFLAGPALASAGISVLGIYLTLVTVLLACNLVTP